MQTNTRHLFTTVRTEGALLPTDLLARVVEGGRDLKGLTPTDYHLLPGERINEATNRAWNRAVGAWAGFQGVRAREAADESAQATRERWLLPLFQELGYGRLERWHTNAIMDGKEYPISHVWRHTPIHLVGAGIDLDRRTAGVAGAARSNPHGLLQGLLNNESGYLWGYVSNGLRLRILRDNKRLSRPAYVEFDLEAMMEGEVYADFVLLWLLTHESRVEAERPEDCWLEQWAQTAREQGMRAREDLRGGVQRAIEALGRGFLAHPANTALRGDLRGGTLDAQAYYHELLLLTYRLLFLFVAEDRELLLAPDADAEAKDRYTRYYSTARLRYLAGHQRGGRHGDLYAMLRVVLGALGDDRGLRGLALPSLGGMLFASGPNSATPHLDECHLTNQEMLAAIRELAYVANQATRRPVDFRNLGPEELGSIYEALLELHPALGVESAHFSLETARGSERKTTGSYYTPESLAAELVKSAVEPVVAAAISRARAEGTDAAQAILNLKICDPAAGSGHFLMTAARILAKRLAQIRSGDDEPSPEDVRHALREVVSQCIYGVDVNPMAVELCKVNLWLESLDPGKPLTFLDHHIKCGNSLIGVTRRDQWEDGVPDGAYDAVAGDEKGLASAIKKRNRQERDAQRHGLEQGSLFATYIPPNPKRSPDAHRLDVWPDDTPAQYHAKQREFERQSQEDAERRMADAWCAAFFWPLDRAHQNDERSALTQTGLLHYAQDPASTPLADQIRRLARAQRFFHWYLEFPSVFNGHQGFDCILSNPPWERIKLQEQEFFAQRDPTIATAPNAAARKRLIAALATSEDEADRALHAAFTEAQHTAEAQSKFLRASGRYPLTARGDINVYSTFAENDRALIAPTGRAGIIVPTGIATDDTNKTFFADVVEKRALVSLYDFENRQGLFPAIDSRLKFSLLTLAGEGRGPAEADLACFALQADDLRDEQRHFTLTPADFALINPNTRTLPIFRSQRDADLTRRMYRAAPVLVEERGDEQIGPWGISFQRMFDMSNDSGLFRTRGQLGEMGYAAGGDGVYRAEGRDDYVPLYEAKLFHQYDHRFATFAGGPAEDKTRDTTEAEHADPRYHPHPRYWVPRAEVEQALGEWRAPWLLAFRDITNATNERTFIAASIPRVGVGNNAPILLMDDTVQRLSLCLASNLSSLALDYVARQKAGGTHLNFFIVKQLPVLPPETYERVGEWVTWRALELTYTSEDMAPLARDLGYDGPPFAWGEQRRAHLRGELDGLYAHLYGLSRDDFVYVLDTFTVLKKNEERQHGEYRTARLALAAYDALAPLLAGVGARVG